MVKHRVKVDLEFDIHQLEVSFRRQQLHVDGFKYSHRVIFHSADRRAFLHGAAQLQGC